MKLIEMKHPKVLHVITSLDVGGAEMMLFKLIQMSLMTFDSKIIVLMGRGKLSEKFETLCINVEYIAITRGCMPSIAAILKMLSISRQFSPDVIQGWMYHGNVAACLIKFLVCRRASLFWNIRQTLYNLSYEKRLTKWLIRLGKWLSFAPQLIIYNSNLSVIQHEKIGYPKKKSFVIFNGFDIQHFKPNELARESVGCEFGFEPMAPLVIHVGRYHPMKDYYNLLTAAKNILKVDPEINFLLVGHGVTKENKELTNLCLSFGLENNLVLAGERFDLPRLIAAADVAVLSSAWGESFPNVIGEAMACGTVCVATDVGDSAFIIGEFGRVVPPCDPNALSREITALLSDDNLRKDLGSKARNRIENLFSINQVSDAYFNLYKGRLL